MSNKLQGLISFPAFAEQGSEHVYAKSSCLRAGDLMLQQVAATLLNRVTQAGPKDLANLSAGLIELQVFGYKLTNQQLQSIQNRSQQLESSRGKAR